MIDVSYRALLQLTLPQILVALSGMLILTFDATVLRHARLKSRLHAGSLLACIGCASAIIVLIRAELSISLPMGMLVTTPLTRVVEVSLLVLCIFTILLSDSVHPTAAGSTRNLTVQFTAHAGEYLALILFATVAMMFLVTTQNLLLIFVSLEFLSLSLYVLTGFDKQSRASTEAALKYFLFGGMSAAFLLFGFSLLYGLSGSIDLLQIAAATMQAKHDPLLLIAIVMVTAGFGFKLAAAPFHLWAPDAYQGAPTMSAGFISSSSKVASFFVFGQVLTIGLAGVSGTQAWRSHAPGWIPIVCVVAALSMLLGNLAALAQTSLRRLLAYSAIAHAGYMLLGFAADTPQSLAALLYYVLTYALAALGAFGVLSALEAEGIDRITDLAGLSRRAPFLSLCMMVFLLSLAGIPPLAGFFGKFWLFSAALNTRMHFSLLWLVLLAIAASVVSLYYYLRILKQIYVADASLLPPIKTQPLTRFTLGTIALLIILLGCAPNLLIYWMTLPAGFIPR